MSQNDKTERESWRERQKEKEGERMRMREREGERERVIVDNSRFPMQYQIRWSRKTRDYLIVRTLL